MEEVVVEPVEISARVKNGNLKEIKYRNLNDTKSKSDGESHELPYGRRFFFMDWEKKN